MKNSGLRFLRQFGTGFAKGKADGLTKPTRMKERIMNRSRYDDRYWESRLDRLVRGRSGFAWGAFFIGFILGGIIF
jgi:hypothetical protein